MQRRSWTITAAVVAGLALGIIFSPLVGSSRASAQGEAPTTTAQAGTQATSPGSSLRTSFLDKLAAALGIDRPALDTAITNAGNATVDEAVQQGTLTQEQADALRARIQAGDAGALWGGRGFGRGFRDGGPRVAGLKDAVRAAAAQALGMTTDELSTQLRAGQTVAQLAQANGTTEQAVVDAALAAARTRLDEAVAAGTLTQAQADAEYTRLQQAGTNILMHRGGHGRMRPSPDGTAPSTATATPNA